MNTGVGMGPSKGELPTFRIQAGTPLPMGPQLPPVLQSQRPSGQSHAPGGSDKGVSLPALAPALRQVVAIQPTPRDSSGSMATAMQQHQPVSVSSLPMASSLLHKPLKKDPGIGSYASQAGGNLPQQGPRSQPQYQRTAQVSIASMQPPGQSVGAISLRLPNNSLSNYSPTPSEVSNIRMTPTATLGATPVSGRQSVATPRTPIERGQFLEPSMPPPRTEWNAYRVLPSVQQQHTAAIMAVMDHSGVDTGGGMFFPPGSAMSLYHASNQSLSPFPMDLSPGPSLLSSPRHSARSHISLSKKRALSISPLSAEGIDINSIIRTSPTSLVAYINNSRCSSANPSPYLGGANGMAGLSFSSNVGHLTPRQMTPTLAHHQHSYYVKREADSDPLAQMVALERASHVGYVPLDGNHMVVHQQQVQYAEDYLTCKQEVNHNKLVSCSENSYAAPTAAAQASANAGGRRDVDPLRYHPEKQMPPTARHPPLPPAVTAATGSVMQSTPRRPPAHPTLAAQAPPSYQQALHDQVRSVMAAAGHKGSRDESGIATGDEDDDDEEEEEEYSDEDYGGDDAGGSSPRAAPACRWVDCERTFGAKDELVRHVEKAHVDQRRSDDYTCFWRGCKREHKPFNARYKLLIHMRVHTGERPNKCTYDGCNKSFSRLENLKIHQRSHTGERPYKCTFEACAKAFSNSSDRAKHQRTHVDTKPYACQVPGCQKRYTDPSSLRKHVKNHKQAEQQQRKKLRSNESGYSSEGLGDCLNITKLRPTDSPMSVDSQGSLPGTRNDFYPASLSFSVVQSVVTGKVTYAPQNQLPNQNLKTIYTSAHSSRSGTANGYSHMPSPAPYGSMHGSPMATAAMATAPQQLGSPYPNLHSPAAGTPHPALQRSPLPPSNVHGGVMMHHSPQPPPRPTDSLPQPSPRMTARSPLTSVSSMNGYGNTNFLPSHPVIPPIMHQQQQQQQMHTDAMFNMNSPATGSLGLQKERMLLSPYPPGIGTNGIYDHYRQTGIEDMKDNLLSNGGYIQYDSMLMPSQQQIAMSRHASPVPDYRMAYPGTTTAIIHHHHHHHQSVSSSPPSPLPMGMGSTQADYKSAPFRQASPRGLHSFPSPLSPSAIVVPTSEEHFQGNYDSNIGNGLQSVAHYMNYNSYGTLGSPHDSYAMGSSGVAAIMQDENGGYLHFQAADRSSTHLSAMYADGVH